MSSEPETVNLPVCRYCGFAHAEVEAGGIWYCPNINCTGPNPAKSKRPNMCAHCGMRPATLNWVGTGGVLAFTHGMYARWCERCAVQEQLDHARIMAAQIPELEARLCGLE